MRSYIIYKHWKISFVVEYLAYYANNFFLCSEASKLVSPVSSSLKKVINEMTTTTRQLKRWLTLNGEVFLKITLILIRSLKKTGRKVTSFQTSPQFFSSSSFPYIPLALQNHTPSYNRSKLLLSWFSFVPLLSFRQPFCSSGNNELWWRCWYKYSAMIPVSTFHIIGKHVIGL